jgi:hypothetical protein
MTFIKKLKSRFKLSLRRKGCYANDLKKQLVAFAYREHLIQMAQ